MIILVLQLCYPVSVPFRNSTRRPVFWLLVDGAKSTRNKKPRVIICERCANLQHQATVPHLLQQKAQLQLCSGRSQPRGMFYRLLGNHYTRHAVYTGSEVQGFRSVYPALIRHAEEGCSKTRRDERRRGKERKSKARQSKEMRGTEKKARREANCPVEFPLIMCISR